MLSFVLAREDACKRECVPGHVTASALVLDHTGTHALLTLHPRFGRWLQLGGHCEDSDPDIVAAALREASEESGIAGLRIDPDIAALHVHPVICSLGVPTRHLDLQFIAHAPAGRRNRLQRRVIGPALVAARRASRRHRLRAGPTRGGREASA